MAAEAEAAREARAKVRCPSVKMGCFIYILDSSNSIFDLVSLLVALEATEPVSELVTQIALELINIHLISVMLKKLV